MWRIEKCFHLRERKNNGNQNKRALHENHSVSPPVRFIYIISVIVIVIIMWKAYKRIYYSKYI